MLAGAFFHPFLLSSFPPPPSFFVLAFIILVLIESSPCPFVSTLPLSPLFPPSFLPLISPHYQNDLSLSFLEYSNRGMLKDSSRRTPVPDFSFGLFILFVFPVCFFFAFHWRMEKERGGARAVGGAPWKNLHKMEIFQTNGTTKVKPINPSPPPFEHFFKQSSTTTTTTTSTTTNDPRGETIDQNK